MSDNMTLEKFHCKEDNEDYLELIENSNSWDRNLLEVYMNIDNGSSNQIILDEKQVKKMISTLTSWLEK